MVCTSEHMALPLPVLCCPTQGRSQTTQADGLICMLIQLKMAVLRAGLAITQLPWTMDSAYGSQARRARRHPLGCIDIMMAGKGHSVLTIDGQQGEASTGKTGLMLAEPTWGLAVPACRMRGSRPPCGSLLLGWCRTRTPRSSEVMHVSQRSLRGAAIGHRWTQPHVMACCWKSRQAMFQSRFMHLQGDGLYTAWLIKVCASLLALRVQAQRVFSTLTITEIMRTLRREEDVRDCRMTHCHAPWSIG